MLVVVCAEQVVAVSLMHIKGKGTRQGLCRSSSVSGRSHKSGRLVTIRGWMCSCEAGRLIEQSAGRLFKDGTVSKSS